MAPDDVKTTSSLLQPISNSKVNDIWRAGFCDATVEHARLTLESESQKRIDYLREHMKTCLDCRNANTLKDIEHRVAQGLGQDAERLFLAGGDITKLNGFQKQFHKIIGELLRIGAINPHFFVWMQLAASRAGKDYLEEKSRAEEGSKA